jgi:hypothetical protein
LQTSGSTAIRIETPAFKIEDGLEAGLPKVRAALAAAARLISFYRQHRDHLNRAAFDAPLLVVRLTR